MLNTKRGSLPGHVVAGFLERFPAGIWLRFWEKRPWARSQELFQRAEPARSTCSSPAWASRLPAELQKPRGLGLGIFKPPWPGRLCLLLFSLPAITELFGASRPAARGCAAPSRAAGRARRCLVYHSVGCSANIPILAPNCSQRQVILGGGGLACYLL